MDAKYAINIETDIIINGTNEKTCECTDNWHSLKEPLIRQTRDGKNNLTRQLRLEKK